MANSQDSSEELEQAELSPTIMRMSEQDGLRMLRKYPSLWKALEVRHAQSDSPEYWFTFDVFTTRGEEDAYD